MKSGSKADPSNGRTAGSSATSLQQHAAAAADPSAFDAGIDGIGDGGAFAAATAALLVVGLRVQQLPVALCFLVRTDGVAQSLVFRQQSVARSQQSGAHLRPSSAHHRSAQLCFHHAGASPLSTTSTSDYHSSVMNTLKTKILINLTLKTKILINLTLKTRILTLKTTI